MSDVLDRLAIHLSQHVRTTQRDYLSICRRFLRTFPQPADWTPEAVFVFLQELEASGWNPLSRQRAVTALRKLYTVFEKGFPALPRGAFSLDILDQERPMLSLEELVALIRASVRAPWPELAGMVALATVYGLRGGEIAVLREKDLNLAAGEVRITTGKQNAVRVHGIPAAIRPVLHPENFGQPRSSTEMWGWWHDLEARAGIGHRTRQGWHAVRRGVVAVLLDAGVPEAVLEPWMGWRASLGRMVRRYPLRGRQEMDQEVFGRHPLLTVWAEQAPSTEDALFKYKIPSGTLNSDQKATKVRAWGRTEDVRRERRTVAPKRSEELALLAAICGGLENLTPEMLKSAILTPREEEVLRLRFGIGDGRNPHTFEKIGYHFNVTRERIRQIVHKALRKLATRPAARS